MKCKKYTYFIHHKIKVLISWQYQPAQVFLPFCQSPDLQRVARTMRVVQKGFGLSNKLLCCISALPTQALKTEAKGDLLSEINNFQ